MTAGFDTTRLRRVTQPADVTPVTEWRSRIEVTGGCIEASGLH